VEAAFCENHNFELAEDLCGTCGRAYCPECILYAYGPKKPPICKACAIAKAGIRKHAAPSAVASKRELRRLSRERRREVKAAKRAKPEPVQTISADMDWSSIDDEEPGVHGSAPPLGPGMGFEVDARELREVRPSFDTSLTGSR
jgi:hypothetical protein